MKKKFDFMGKKYRSLLLTSSFSMSIEALILISDTLVVGHLIGEKGMAGINLVTGIYSVVAFLSLMISMGSIYRYTAAVGSFQKEKANRFFGQGLLLSIGIGLIMFLLVYFGENAYFQTMGAKGEILHHAKAYYSYFRFTVLIFPIYCLLVEMVYADGDEMICNLSYIAQILGNIVLSIFLCMKIGTAGSALGTLIGTSISLAIVMLHFFKKKNSLHPILHFNLKDCWEVISYSLVDAGLYFFWGILDVFMCILVIVRFGEDYLPILTALITMVELTIVFDGVSAAVVPLFNLYRGEGNELGIKRLMTRASKDAVIEGILFSVLLFVMADYIPMMFNIRTPELKELCVTVIRWYAPTMICTSLLFLYASYYLMRDHLGIALFIMGIKDLIVPALLSYLLIPYLGILGICIAFGLAPVISLLCAYLLSGLIFGWKMTPMLIPDNQPPTYLYSIHVREEEIIALRNQVEIELKKEKVSPNSIHKIMLFIEDFYMATKEKNENNKLVGSELSLILKEDIYLVIKDNGTVFDATQKENHNNLREKVIHSLLENSRGSKYMLTTSFNRHEFTVER